MMLKRESRIVPSYLYKRKTEILMDKLFSSHPTEVDTCVVHRVTLLPELFCYRCKGTCQSIVKDEVRVCLNCRRYLILRDGAYCSKCYQCRTCRRWSRLPGFCLWCGLLFSAKALQTMFRENPQHILAYLVSVRTEKGSVSPPLGLLYPRHEFMQANSEQRCTTRNLVRLILSFL